MTQHNSPRPPRFCANCGAHNLTTSANCGVCGQLLVKQEELATLWGTDAGVKSNGETEVIDLYPAFDLSSQATTPFTQTRPFDPAEKRVSPPAPAGRDRAADPWASSSGRLIQSEPAPSAAAPMPAPAPRSVARVERRGPPGFILGCFAVIPIAALAAVFVWGAIRENISDRVRDEISVGITNELRLIEKVPVPSSGQLVLTEEEINADLDRAADWYSPIEDVRVTIEDGTVWVRFKLYGLSSTYRSGLDVTGGKLVAVDPMLSGPAGRVVDIDEITSIFELEMQELLRRSGVQPVDVTLRNGSLILRTRPIETL